MKFYMIHGFGTKYCNLNFHGLKLLKQKDMVQGLHEMHTEVDTCESCIIGKQHKKSFPKEVSWRECTFGTNSYRHLWTNEDSISWKSKVFFNLYWWFLKNDLGFISWKKSQKHLLHSRNLKPLLRSKKGRNIKTISQW